MELNTNQMGALLLLTWMVASEVLGSYNVYQGYHQAIPVPYYYGFQPKVPFYFDTAMSQAAVPKVSTILPATSPNHYYSPPGNTYSGFSYDTQYQHGALSRVIFVTGPQSRQLMEQSAAQTFRKVSTIPAMLKALTAPLTQETNSSSRTLIRPEPNLSHDVTMTPEPKSVLYPSSISTIPITDPVAPMYRVQVFPSHAPNFLPTPFPYHPFISTFYHEMSQATTTTTPMQENADDAQESMVNEVGTFPVLVNNQNNSLSATPSSPTPTEELPLSEKPLSTAEILPTQETESTTPEQQLTSADPHSDAEPFTGSPPEPVMESSTPKSLSLNPEESVNLANSIQVDSSTDASEVTTTKELSLLDNIPLIVNDGVTEPSEPGTTHVPEENVTPVTTESESEFTTAEG